MEKTKTKQDKDSKIETKIVSSQILSIQNISTGILTKKKKKPKNIFKEKNKNKEFQLTKQKKNL